MRISEKSKLTAKEIINNYSEQELADLFYHYGEEGRARVIATLHLVKF